MRLLSLLSPALLAPMALRVLAHVATPAVGAGSTVDGIVHDSLAHAPLVGAMVQLADAEGTRHVSRSAVTDSLGHYALPDVPDGQYLLGFFHEALDSLGIEAPLRAVTVTAGRDAHVDLAIPSATRLRAAICGASANADDAVIVGTVRSAAGGDPLPGARVAAHWTELSFTEHGLQHRVPRLAATASDRGWFALCGVPRGGLTTLVASAGQDSTARIDVAVGNDGFARRDLLVPRATDAGAPAPTLRGMVVDAGTGLPLRGAQVRLGEGAEARTDTLGAWTLARPPLGTQMLTARAVGYYPERRPVDVGGAGAPIRIALATLRSVLDTVRIAARRVPRERTGFDTRRREGAGSYLTARDIAKRNPLETRDIFRVVPRVRLERDGNGVSWLAMRGPSGVCQPAVYVDGRYFGAVAADDLNAMVRPSEIAGIEIYSAIAAPAQYRQPTVQTASPPTPVGADASLPDEMGSPIRTCGSVMIWRK